MIFNSAAQKAYIHISSAFYKDLNHLSTPRSRVLEAPLTSAMSVAAGYGIDS
jgi:hypothetical protein